MRGGGCREVSSSSPVRPAEVWKASKVWSEAPDWLPDVKMFCDRPFIVPGRVAWPCGRCPSCLVKVKKIWAHRIMLEASCHAENCFVTITYDPERCPVELRPDDFTEWVKRLRYFVSSRGGGPIRYFGCGEYGDRGGRPHYHAAVFGVGCGLGPVRVGKDGGRSCWCSTCQAVRDSWKLGHSMVGSLEVRSAAYIAGYVLKKMRDTSDIGSRAPPFTRMSLRPHGIGVSAMKAVASGLSPAVLERMNGDVPVGLRIGKSVWPLGRYLRNHLRELVGLEEGCPQHIQDELKEKVRVVYEYADAIAKDDPRLWRVAVKQAFEAVNEQSNRNVAARNIKRGSL